MEVTTFVKEQVTETLKYKPLSDAEMLALMWNTGVAEAMVNFLQFDALVTPVTSHYSDFYTYMDFINLETKAVNTITNEENNHELYEEIVEAYLSHIDEAGLTELFDSSTPSDFELFLYLNVVRFGEIQFYSSVLYLGNSKEIKVDPNGHTLHATMGALRPLIESVGSYGLKESKRNTALVEGLEKVIKTALEANMPIVKPDSNKTQDNINTEDTTEKEAQERRKGFRVIK